jgi:ACS family glucarate transporter-like MFS transporter
MKYGNRVVALLSLLSVITYLDRVCIAVAGPRIQAELHIGPQAWGWVTGMFALSYAFFEIPSGILGDRIGPRRVLTRIVLWWSVFTSLTGAVSNYIFLLITRFCFGIGEAGAYPNAGSVIARWIPPQQRARAWGIVWMTSQIGGAISPLLVVPIQMRFGWRASFFTFGILGVIWSGIWYWWYRDSPVEKPGVTQAELDRLAEVADLKHQPLAWRVVLCSGNLWRIMSIGFLYVYTLYFFQSWFQTFLVKDRGFTEGDLLLSAVPYLVGACGNLLGGIASDWLVRLTGLTAGRRIVGVVGLGLSAVCMAATLLTHNNSLTLIFLSLVYGGMTFQQPSIFAVCSEIGGPLAGTITGFFQTACQAGAFVSSVVFGYVVKAYGSYQAPLVPMAVFLGISALLWLSIDSSKKLYSPDKLEPALINN